MQFIYILLSFADFITRAFVSKHRVTILLYHNPKIEVFERHIKYLVKHYNFVSLRSYIEAVKSDNFSVLPLHSLIITFDDGYKDNYNLLPVFRKYRIAPTIYLVTENIGTTTPFWWELIESKQEKNYLKNLKNSERLAIIKNYKIEAGKINKFTRSALSFSELNEMKECVEFESHTHTHPILTSMTQKERYGELEKSLLIIKDKLDINASAIAYPNGDYSMNDIPLLLKLGYTSGRTTNVGWNNKKTNLFELKCIGISDDATIFKFKFQLSGIFGYFLNLFMGGDLKGKKKLIKLKVNNRPQNKSW